MAITGTGKSIYECRLLAGWQSQQVLGLAGYRIQENLLYGRFLYLDDLVTVARDWAVC